MSPPRNPLVALQYVLPHRLLSRAACALARWQWRPWKNFFIGRIVAHFKPAMEEAVESDPFAYPSFNAFFTRALKPDARPIDADPNARREVLGRADRPPAHGAARRLPGHRALRHL